MNVSVISMPVGLGPSTVSAHLAETPEIRHSPQREQLLSAAARASRVLLGATEVMSVMPAVLHELGEAAGVDRTVLAIVETDADAARWLVVKSEWLPPRGGGGGREGGRTAVGR